MRTTARLLSETCGVRSPTDSPDRSPVGPVGHLAKAGHGWHGTGSMKLVHEVRSLGSCRIPACRWQQRGGT